MSSIGLAVALLARAVDAGTQAQAACSTADDHARTMLDIYTQIADDSGQDAPNAAGRNVSDAQDTLQQITNNLHHAAEALGDYVRTIAPDLAGSIKRVSDYRPTGADLLELPGKRTSPIARMGRVTVNRLDDVTDAARESAETVGALKKYSTLPKGPGPSQEITRQPTPDTPTVRAADTGVPAGTILEISVMSVAIVINLKRFGQRISRMIKARPNHGNT